MVVAQNSLLAYYSLVPEHTITMRGKVYKIICDRCGVSDKELAMILQVPINRVTPRRHELLKMGLIKELCTVKCSQTGRTMSLWVHS